MAETTMIERGDNDTLIDSNGARYLDLFAGTGSVVLGHANARINAAISTQLDRLSATSQLHTTIQDDARTLVESFFPESLGLYHLFSTGMEASETALRLVRRISRRKGVIGFSKSMHGKSLATAALSWENPEDPAIGDYHRLPFIQDHNESDIIERVTALLRTREIGAVFVEPVQGVGGGYRASDHFYKSVFKACRDSDTLLVFDEILSGFYRTGTPFYFSRLGFVPDIVLIGKAMGNGFPVSGIMVDRKFLPIDTRFGLTSTYSHNPLACAAVVGTLTEMRRLDVESQVIAIEEILARELADLSGVKVRLTGALCVIEMKDAVAAQQIKSRAFERGIHLSAGGVHVRLLPTYTVNLKKLNKAAREISWLIQENKPTH